MYEIVRSITLRSNLHLRGDDGATIIRLKHPYAQAALRKAGAAGDTKVLVAGVPGLHVGDEVCVNAEQAKGWKSTHALITAIDGNAITLDRPLVSAYATEKGATVANLFPAIYAKDAENIVVERLAIDGRWQKEPVARQEFTVSAVHFDNVRDSAVTRIHVQRYPADGISVQRGGNVSVDHCLSEHNLGHGFHPGSKLASGSWTDNVGRYNGEDGFFFCQNVRYLNVSGSRFHDNRGHGIGNLGFGGEGDRYNVVTANFCYDNGLCGIEALGGGDNVVSNNVCENNSRSEPNRWPGILVENTHGTIVAGNRCVDSQPEDSKTQGYGILVRRQSADNVITGNMMSGHARGGIDGDALAGNTVKDNVVVAAHAKNQP